MTVAQERENYIREFMMDDGFPTKAFMCNVDEYSIDFIREFKDDIWWDEVFDWVSDDEDFVAEYYPQLMEFWKEYKRGSKNG